MKKIVIVLLLTVGVLLLIANIAVVVSEGQYGYYDSGDGYVYKQWATPGLYFKLPWTKAFVTQQWSLFVPAPEDGYLTCDGETLLMDFVVSGHFGNNVTGAALDEEFTNKSRLHVAALQRATKEIVEQYTLDEIIRPKGIHDFYTILSNKAQDIMVGYGLTAKGVFVNTNFAR